MKKKPGAKPGNKNALKHGIYSAAFKAAEVRFLDTMPKVDLLAEVDLIRVMKSRFLESAQASPEPLDPQTQLSALRVVCLSAQAITSLLRLQSLRGVKDKESDEIVQKILSIPEDEQNDPDAPK
jgi:hypothetical protein